MSKCESSWDVCIWMAWRFDRSWTSGAHPCRTVWCKIRNLPFLSIKVNVHSETWSTSNKIHTVLSTLHVCFLWTVTLYSQTTNWKWLHPWTFYHCQQCAKSGFLMFTNIMQHAVAISTTCFWDCSGFVRNSSQLQEGMNFLSQYYLRMKNASARQFKENKAIL